ncbi:tail fiber protein, partial [Escherichia coli]|nr:tail fiber protein [Escherichia coli]
MAKLNESAVWEDGIYQLEVSDPVLGGPGGIANRQAEQLANRTAYLKKKAERQDKELEDHQKASDPHTQYAHKESPAFSGTPTAPTADKADNSNKLATTKFVKGAIADLQSKLDNNQPVDCYTKAESDTRYPDSGSVAYLTKSTIQRFQGSIEVRDIFSIYTLNDVNGLRLEPGLKNNIGLKRRGKWTYYSFPDKDGELALKSDLTSLLDGLDIYPVGAPLPWPLATPPSGYLICNG